jgi:hypothetical protein
MNRYPDQTPRMTLGLAAVAMTAMTFGLLVVAPAKMNGGGASAPATTAADAPVAIEVAISPARIDVVGERAQKTAFEPTRQILPKQAHAG